MGCLQDNGAHNYLQQRERGRSSLLATSRGTSAPTSVQLRSRSVSAGHCPSTPTRHSATPAVIMMCRNRRKVRDVHYFSPVDTTLKATAFLSTLITMSSRCSNDGHYTRTPPNFDGPATVSLPRPVKSSTSVVRRQVETITASSDMISVLVQFRRYSKEVDTHVHNGRQEHLVHLLHHSV